MRVPEDRFQYRVPNAKVHEQQTQYRWQFHQQDADHADASNETAKYAQVAIADHNRSGDAWPRNQALECAGITTFAGPTCASDHLTPYADRLCASRVVKSPVRGTFAAQSTNEKELAVASSL